MEKTRAALDELFSTIVRMVSSWFSMLTSTRVLAFIVTAAALYLQYAGSGFSTWESITFAVLTSLTGVSFMAVKTIRSGSPASTLPAAPEAPALPSPKPVPAAPVKPVIQYQTPWDWDDYVGGLEGTASEKYMQFTHDVLQGYDLLQLNPEIRLDVAKEIIEKTLDLAKTAWTEQIGINPATNEGWYRYPEPSDLKTFNSKELFKKQAQDAIPGCQWLDEKVMTLFRDFDDIYNYRVELAKLAGKTIRWYNDNGSPRIKVTIVLATMGLSAV